MGLLWWAVSGKTGNVTPHRRKGGYVDDRHAKKVAEHKAKLAEVDDFLKPEKQAERRKQRARERGVESRKYKRLWG